MMLNPALGIAAILKHLQDQQGTVTPPLVPSVPQAPATGAPMNFVTPDNQAPQTTAQDLIRMAGQIPDAAPRRPTLGTRDLPVALLALLSGNQAGNVVNGFVQGKAQRAEQDTQYDQSAVNRQRQALLQQAQGIQTGDKLRADAAESAADRASRESIAAGNNQTQRLDTEARVRAAADEKATQNQLRLDRDNQTAAAQILTKYQGAKTLPQMKLAQKLYNARVAPDAQIDDATVTQDYHDRQREYIARARDQFGKSIDRELNHFGEVSPEAAKRLKAERTGLVSSYGIDSKSLQDIPSGETMKARAMKERSEQFKQTFGLKQTQWQQSLAQRVASFDLAKQRFEYAQQHGNAMLGIAQGALAVSQGNLAQRQYESTFRGAKNEQEDALKKLDQQIRGTNAAINAATDEKQIAALKTTKASLLGQREFVVGLLPEALQAQDTADALGELTGVPAVNPLTQGQPKKMGRPLHNSGAAPFNPLQGNIGAGPPSGSGTTRSGVRYRVLQ